MALPAYTPPPREKVSVRQRFAAWRRSRPFWGGIWTAVAGIYLWSLTAAPIGVVVIQGTAAISAIVICLVYLVLVAVTWSQPQLRVATGLIVVILALAAILLTNLGGFLVGTLMALHGGASMAAWKPVVQRWQRPTPAAESGPVRVLVAATPADGVPVVAQADDASDGADDKYDDDSYGDPADDGAPDDAAQDVDGDADDADDADGPDDAVPTVEAADDASGGDFDERPDDRPAGSARTATPPRGMTAGMTILPAAPAGDVTPTVAR